VSTVSTFATAGAPSPSRTVSSRCSTPVFPGVEHRELTVRLGDGAPAVANVLTVDTRDQGLEVVPVLANDRVGGLETVPSMGTRLLDEGLLAGVNGGFWLADPVGDPNGYLALDGALVSESQTQGSGPRGTFAVTGDGTPLFDRLTTDVALTTPAGTRTVDGLNRGRAEGDEVLVYTTAFGDDITVAPPAIGLVVDGLVPLTGGSDEGTVTEVHTEGELPASEGSAVVVAHDQAARELAGVEEGTRISVNTEPRPLATDPQAWADAAGGLAAGPLIVAEGRTTSPEGWESEGFAPQVHSLVRHPRSAVARTADGELLLVTVDGRQPGYSSGMTIAELADFLIGLGAVDALSLDGGGSSQFVVEGRLRNRPCCDPSLRPVANGLFVRTSYPFEHARRLAGADRAGTAAAIAGEAHPGGAAEVVLANQARFPDALAGGPLAVSVGGPLLLTSADALPDETRDALDELAPETVTVLGGVEAIGEAVVAELTARGHTVRRLAGPDRTATAAAVAQALPPGATRAFLASAVDFPDALTAAAPAGLMRAPVLLTAPGELAPDASRALRAAGVGEVVVAGGEAAIGQDVEDQLVDLGLVVTRLAGDDRYGTARAVNSWAASTLACPAGQAETQTACLDPAKLVVARGDVFADALGGGPLAAAERSLLAIVPRDDVYAHPEAADYLREREAEVTAVTLLGGVAALSSYEHWQLDQLAR
jgi:putative cell wall-binding protein